MTGRDHQKQSYCKMLRGVLGITASLLVYSQVTDANARRHLIPNRPSIEVNLEVLQYLQNDAYPTRHAAVPFQQKQRVVAPAVQAPRQLQTQPLQTQPLPVQRAPMRVASVPARSQPKLPPPPAPSKPYATYQQHGWGDNKPETAPAKPTTRPKTYTHAPVKPKVVSKPKPVVMQKPVELPKPAPAQKPIEAPPALPPVAAPKIPDVKSIETPKPIEEVSPSPVPKLPEVTAQIPKTTDPFAPASAMPNLPEPDMAAIDFEEFPKLEPMPEVPDMPAAPAPAVAPPEPIVPPALPDAPSVPMAVPDATPAIVPLDVPDMPAMPTPMAAPPSLPPVSEALPSMENLPVSSLPAPKPMKPAKPRAVAKPIAPVPSVPTDVALPPMPDMPAAPLPDMAPAPLPTPPSDSALPSLSKGLDDFMIKDQPPVGNPDLPDLTPITGGNEPAASAQSVSTGLPSLEALTGVPETPSMSAPQPVVPPALPDAPSLPPLDKAQGLPELPTIDGLPSLDAPAPLEPLPVPAEQKIAALPPIDHDAPGASAPKGAAGSKALTINFAATETEVPVSEQAKLASLAQSMINSGQAVRIEAFAGGSPEQANVARRVSLSRALAIRAYLIDKGVKNLKINVQPLGNKVKGDPERADIIYQ